VIPSPYRPAPPAPAVTPRWRAPFLRVAELWGFDDALTRFRWFRRLVGGHWCRMIWHGKPLRWKQPSEITRELFDGDCHGVAIRTDPESRMFSVWAECEDYPGTRSGGPR
jgi:hypothetical protein